jgi:antitoxin ParD1/3/4
LRACFRQISSFCFWYKIWWLAASGGELIFPLEGKMSDRTEGGATMVCKAVAKHDSIPSTIDKNWQPSHIYRTKTKKGSAMATMNISLTKGLQEYVENEVATGDFASASEVVRAGLRALRDERAIAKEKLEILRRNVAVGFDEMQGGLYLDKTVDQIADEVLRRHKL